jgi:hypothetical protein
VYKIKFNACVCSVEVSSALKMDAVTFCENWTVLSYTARRDMPADDGARFLWCCNVLQLYEKPSSSNVLTVGFSVTFCFTVKKRRFSLAGYKIWNTKKS